MIFSSIFAIIGLFKKYDYGELALIWTLMGFMECLMYAIIIMVIFK